MLDFIYTLLIAPLEYWMHAALVWGYSHTANWGWAIVVMSLAVNTVILPIYIKAEKWQEDERALRKSFESKEQMDTFCQYALEIKEPEVLPEIPVKKTTRVRKTAGAKRSSKISQKGSENS